MAGSRSRVVKALAHCGRAVLFLCTLSAAVPDSPSAFAAEPSALEFAIKATFVYKFAPFVSWPPNAFTNAQSPFAICVAGQDEVGGIIEQAAAGQAVGSRSIVTRRVSAPPPGGSCQILYIANSNSKLAEQMISGVSGAPVLTITDGAGQRSRGIVNFLVVDNHVRFDIDESVARRSNLSISSKILELAHNVVLSGRDQ